MNFTSAQAKVLLALEDTDSFLGNLDIRDWQPVNHAGQTLSPLETYTSVSQSQKYGPNRQISTSRLIATEVNLN